MSMSYVDYLYTDNCDKVFDIVCDGDGKFKEEDFEREMGKIKDNKLNELFSSVYKLKSQLEKAEEVILEYNSNYDYYCCELAGSWSEIRKKAREYFSEKADK